VHSTNYWSVSCVVPSCFEEDGQWCFVEGWILNIGEYEEVKGRWAAESEAQSGGGWLVMQDIEEVWFDDAWWRQSESPDLALELDRKLRERVEFRRLGRKTRCHGAAGYVEPEQR
jgi:hypothetical protein